MKKKLRAVTLMTAVTIAASWPRRMAMKRTASRYRTPRPVTGATSSSRATTPVARATEATISAASAAILAASCVKLPIAQQAIDRAGDLRVRERVGREALAESRLVDALGVVVLVPEDGQQHHRLAEVHAFGDGVVATVCDHEVYMREYRDLGEELGARHIGRELVGLVLRTLRYHVAMRRLGERFDQALHQGHVGGPQRSEAQIDERAIALGELVRHAPRRVAPADARLEVVPGGAQRL